MGTHALTIVETAWDRNEEPTEIVRLYRQMDGYFSGHGEDLANFLAPRVITNGLSGNENASNGPEELAAHLIHYLKEMYPSGNIYLHKASWGDKEEYVYTVTALQSGEILVKAVRGYSDPELKFKGTAEEFAEFVKEPEVW